MRLFKSLTELEQTWHPTIELWLVDSSTTTNQSQVRARSTNKMYWDVTILSMVLLVPTRVIVEELKFAFDFHLNKCFTSIKVVTCTLCTEWHPFVLHQSFPSGSWSEMQLEWVTPANVKGNWQDFPGEGPPTVLHEDFPADWPDKVNSLWQKLVSSDTIVKNKQIGNISSCSLGIFSQIKCNLISLIVSQ